MSSLYRIVRTPYYEQLVQEASRRGVLRKPRLEPSPVPSSPVPPPPHRGTTRKLDDPPPSPPPRVSEATKPQPPGAPRGFPALRQKLEWLLAKRARSSVPLVRILFDSGPLSGRGIFIQNVNPPDNPAGFLKFGRKNTQGEQFFIEVPSPYVSSQQCKLVFLGGKLILVNYSSTNPTQYKGNPIPANASVYVDSLAPIKIGDLVFTAEVLAQEARRRR